MNQLPQQEIRHFNVSESREELAIAVHDLLRHCGDDPSVVLAVFASVHAVASGLKELLAHCNAAEQITYWVAGSDGWLSQKVSDATWDLDSVLVEFEKVLEVVRNTAAGQLAVAGNGRRAGDLWLMQSMTHKVSSALGLLSSCEDLLMLYQANRRGQAEEDDVIRIKSALAAALHQAQEIEAQALSLREHSNS